MAPRGSDLVVIASARGRPGSGEELERALRAVAVPTRDRAGSVAFSVYRAAHAPSTFVAFERWASREDHDRHLQSPHVATLMSAMGPILAEPPAIVEYQIVDEQLAANEYVSPSRPAINHSIPIAATPEEVYPLVVTAEGFRRWWAADVTESGGRVELGFFNRATVYRLRLGPDESRSHADWVCETGDEWNGTHIVFRMEPTAAGTLLRFAHSDWRAASDYFVACNTTWGELMYRLKAVAEGKAAGPLFSAAGMAY